MSVAHPQFEEFAKSADFARLSEALNDVLSAIGNPSHDCVLCAGVAAESLRLLGFDASAVAGSAVWRVGPGDGDLICHAPEVANQSVVKPASGVPAGLFHAWVECEDCILDITTSQIRDKAASLDAHDGGKTQVDWAPAVLVTHKSAIKPLREVINLPDGGHYYYARHPVIEAVVLPQQGLSRDFERLAKVVLMTYSMKQDGHEVAIVPVG